MRIRSKKKGLTLVEVLVSIAILGIIVAPIGYMGLSSAKNSVQGKENQQGTYLAQRVLETVKTVNGDNIDNLFSQIQAKFPSFITGALANQGTIYYDSNGNVSDIHNYKYRVEVRLTAANHDLVNTQGSSVFNHIVDINNIDSMEKDSTQYVINNNEIKVKFESTGDNYGIYLNDNANLGWSFPQTDLAGNNNLTININQNFTNTNILKIRVENSTEQNFNIYVNKDDSLTNANYTLVNSFGRVNTFLNYEDNRKYVQMRNSVKLDLITYKSDGQQIAHLEQYKNLDE